MPKLRFYQEEAVESLFDFFAKHRGTDKNGLPVNANPIIALPTGTGKSVVIAEFFKQALTRYPLTRGIMSTHVKTLIDQNAKRMLGQWPIAPLGIYSAGLKSRDNMQPIIFGGIQSMVNKYPVFGYRDFLVIDEAHLLSPNSDTSYVKFINELRYGIDFDPAKHEVTPELVKKALASGNCNPYLKVIGLTATPYRLGLGHMTNGNIFTHTAYDMCTMNGFARLLAEGYLCPLIPKPTQTELDTSDVTISGGDFVASSLEKAVDKNDVTIACLRELLEASVNRRCGLIFASGVEHANHIHQMMTGLFGQSCVIIHSNTKDYKRTEKENDEALEAWLSGEAKWAVNMNSLTTGVDNPKVDVIGMLRPTLSTGLWVQMLGRGTRPYFHPAYSFEQLEDFNTRWQAIREGGKANCLVLDFAKNTPRLGPINDPVVPRPKGKGSPGEAPVKICKKCGTYNHTSARVCFVCTEEFVFEQKLTQKAGSHELIKSDLPQVESFKVKSQNLSAHTTKAGRKVIRVAYYTEPIRTFFEYVTVTPPNEYAKHDYMSHQGREWFRQRFAGEPPETNEEVLQLASQLRAPENIDVWVNTQFPKIMSVRF